MVILLHNDIYSPPSRLLRMALRHLKVEYENVNVSIAEDQHRTPKYEKLNYRKQVPIYQEDDDIVISESRATLQYLGDKYAERDPNFYPKDLHERAKVNEMLIRDMDNYRKIYAYVNTNGVFMQKEIHNQKQEEGALKVLQEYEHYLNGHPYLVGKNMTIADLSAYCTVAYLSLLNFDRWSDYPRVAEWRKRIEALDCFSEWTKGHEMFVQGYQYCHAAAGEYLKKKEEDEKKK